MPTIKRQDKIIVEKYSNIIKWKWKLLPTIQCSMGSRKLYIFPLKPFCTLMRFLRNSCVVDGFNSCFNSIASVTF